MIYRESDEPIEPPDPEALALAELAARARQLRMRVLLPCIAGVILAGIGSALVVRQAQFAVANVHMPYLTAATVAPLVGLGFRGVQRLTDAIVRRRARSWREALARRYSLDLAGFEELTEHV